MSMYSRGKSGPVPSDAQAREKLIVYVYEYLHHAGAPGAAEKFLQEIQWAKGQITPNEAPGFLHSWWCVFWDLYCAAPERRDNFPHSKEASSFHDYSVMTSTGYPMSPNLNGMGMPPGAGQPPHHPHALRMRRILEDKAQGRAAETQTVQMDHFVRLRRLIKMPVGLTVGGITAIDSCYAFSPQPADCAFALRGIRLLLTFILLTHWQRFTVS